MNNIPNDMKKALEELGDVSTSANVAKALIEQNLKLKRLLAEACDYLDDSSERALQNFCSEELQQWFEEHRKEKGQT